MKMLLTILLKTSYNVTEVMVVLIVLLLALKLVQSGVHHKKGGWTGSQFFEEVCWE